MAEKRKMQSKEIGLLSDRVDRLEMMFQMRQSGGESNGGGGSERSRFCALPEVPERSFAPEVSEHRARLIRYIDKKWVNGTRLNYYFFDSGRYSAGNEQLDLVRRGFEAWAELGIGIRFEEVSNISEAQVRIGFLQDGSSWSYVGRDVIDIPRPNERTMNFGWDLTRDPRGGGLDTPIHEIGHTLGFPHEHQNPFSGIVWDEEAVYDSFGGPPNNWTRAQTYHNVLRKLPPSSVDGSPWDPNSIMHYSFGTGLIRQPERYRRGLRPADGLSDIDIAEVRKFYPPLDDNRNPGLEVLKPAYLTLAPAEQMNFNIQVERSDTYTIQTFGRSDTVMVLFEEVDGELEYVTADDDSGTDLNAQLKLRLHKNKKYVLRLRMYARWSTGDTALMMW